MDLGEESIKQPNQGYQNASQYEQLKSEYSASGITYKSNQILHKISLIKGYPYPIILEIAKHFHLNQFEVIFFCHILTDEENSYDADPNIFQTTMNLPQLTKIYNRMSKNGEIQIKIVRAHYKGRIQQQDEDDDQNENENGDAESKETPTSTWSLKELRKLFIYLLVIGYSVKYYLNESTKAYEDEMKRKYPDFFTSIFNVWVDKYSNKVLRTNPRKINQFYIQLFQNEENTAIDNSEIDCQYRNYNQIVEELIKATSDGDEVFQNEEQRELTQN